MSVLSIEHLYYSYDNGKTPVLKDANFEFEKGKTYAIVGKSGAGKTTLLSLISGLDQSSDGKILYEGQDITKIDREKYRSQNIGVIFQSFNLLRHLTALENVILSMDVAGLKVGDKKQHALEMLRKVGLDEEKANRRVLKLSGGEQQRVAIARALSYNPDIIIADEPTGNLDSRTEMEVIGILKDLAAEDGKCVIIVTHSPSVSQNVDVIYELQPLVQSA
ncbi:ABC-type antimicrobial peptide transport system, ATPase component [Desulfosporosinus orientis DSM 765]|uniref:ABC-type antimicrobial peptide transport system, ATPase component n=1 Tax=Desulfosporosinus orientis (strain ATCC 19365 / DSM 765 / NCIMB 8382 / VKM B-1628 / Singapore I) TaxID=768706 RepID=G7W8P3_DESOD|nr:ABC transporter ATP-binding protein [Desulfosporosinus orientis]AET67470.1 ABC-type antimicrobial peptide transport system, ATPase component [Desulfosporosinus orientis DSM 765]